MEEDRAPNPVLRVLSGLGGVIVLLISLLFSLGASLGAPVGFYVASRRARRRGRPLNRIASLMAAVAASIILAVFALLLLFAVLPSSAWDEMRKSAAEAQAAQDTLPPPAWVTKTFPPTAQSDSLAKKYAPSPGTFFAGTGIGMAFVAIVFGAIGGGMGWVATVLLRYAIWGIRT